MGPLSIRGMATFLFSVALLYMTGCTPMAEMGPTTAIPQGVHLLVDAQVFVAEADGVISVDYQVNVLSGGTMGCEGANIVVTWPEPLESRTLRGPWTGMKSHLAPGERWMASGQRDIEPRDTNLTQVRQWAEEIRFSLTCTGDYRNAVLPQVHR